MSAQDVYSSWASALGLLAYMLDSLRAIENTKLASFVAATIVVYDQIICIEREVELIWRKRWSIIKVAYIWHRYFGLLCVLFQAYALNSRTVDDDVRSFWFRWELCGYCAVLFTSEAVLLLWIYIVYNKNKYIMVLVGAFYLAEVVAVIGILVVSFNAKYHAQARGIPGMQYCAIVEIPGTFRLLWVPILAYDSVALLLFLYRGCAGYSLACNRKLMFEYDGLIDMIYRHSLLNVMAIFVSYLACAIIWLTQDVSLWQIPVGFALSLSITNCTRLLLNIRRAYYEGPHAGYAEQPPALLVVRRDLPEIAELPPPPLSLSSGRKRRRPGTSESWLSVTLTELVPQRAAPVVFVGAGGADAEWWQHELREMRADPEIVGEAL